MALAGRMQVCTSLQTDNNTSTPPLSFLQTGCPCCHPINSVKAPKAIAVKAICHIRLLKLKIWTLREVLGTNMHHYAKFNQNWSKGCRDTLYGDLTVYRTAAVCHLGFLKFNFLRSEWLRDPFCTTVPKITISPPEISWFSRWQPTPSWIFKNSKF